MGHIVQISSGLPSCIRPGEVLGGKYRLERELGRGAMGTVWAAMHLSLGQRVAIKLIAAEHAQSAEARIRFSTEAKAAARLKSRHVVQVYDDGETSEGTPYIVMEYLEGESLETRLEREGAVPLIDAVRVTGQVARALARAHARGIVHRDLKPGNIFLARSDDDELGWIAKVLDFGIAKLEEQRGNSTTKTGTVLGTPLFMSPEQVRGASTVDHRTDLYSLGICFFNMASGRLVFDGESFGDVLVSICTEPLPDLRQHAPWVPESLAVWFQRCCAREPAARFQSADELWEELQGAVRGNLQLGNRLPLAEDQLGPSGTLKGHSPPLPPETTLLGAEDSGTFGVAPALSRDGSLASTAPPPELGLSHATPSVTTLNELGGRKRRRPARAVWFAGGAIVLGLVASAGALLNEVPNADGAPPEESVVDASRARTGAPRPSEARPAASLELRVASAQPTHPAPAETKAARAELQAAPPAKNSAPKPGASQTAPADLDAQTMRPTKPTRPSPQRTTKPPANLDLGF